MEARKQTRRNARLAGALVAVVVGMVGMAFAAVPLYDLFCRVTGYGGTTRQADAASERVIEREMVVRFDSNIVGLPWSFRAPDGGVRLKVGETGQAVFVAENGSDRPTTGTAVFNVSPFAAGAYFNKIECFCFTEQRLEPGERIEMPVQFFLDPANVGDYFALLKPRVMSLVVFTALVGMAMAPAWLHPVETVVALIAIAAGAGASGALNMWYEADIDALMARTARRPIPAGAVGPEDALFFGVALAVFAVMVLGLSANWLAAGLLAFTIFFYAVVYTIWLKRRTAQNIVIGGAAGALPPVIGWTAMTGAVAPEPLVLFLIIFLWTPPHFWALALFRREDYVRARLPMMPNIAGEASTRRQILAYSALLAAAGISPWLLGHAGPAYGVVAALMGAEFVRRAVLLLRRGEADDHRAAKGLFGFSILYLFAVFAALLIEAVLVRALAGMS